MKSALISLALLMTMMGTASAQIQEVQGQGAASGQGLVRGRGLMRGQGTVSGNGVVFYRDDEGRVRRRCGSGTVEGQGIAIGRGRGWGQGRACGQGRAFGRGRVRPCR